LSGRIGVPPTAITARREEMAVVKKREGVAWVPCQSQKKDDSITTLSRRWRLNIGITKNSRRTHSVPLQFKVLYEHWLFFPEPHIILFIVDADEQEGGEEERTPGLSLVMKRDLLIMAFFCRSLALPSHQSFHLIF